MRAHYEQPGFPAAAAIDDVADSAENGWSFLGQMGRAVLVARVPGDAAEGVSRMVLVSGLGREDHHLTAFRIQQLAAAGPGRGGPRGGQDPGGECPWGPEDDGGWEALPGLRSEQEEVAVGADGVSVEVLPGTVEVVLDFAPLLGARCVRVQPERSDCAETDNAVVNEVEVVSHAGGGRWEQVRAEVALDGAVVEVRALPLAEPAGARAGTPPEHLEAMRRHRVWLPEATGMHEVEVRLGAPLRQTLRAVFEKLALRVRTVVTFPFDGYVFGREMQAFVRIDSQEQQCHEGAPLDNSTGACWAVRTDKRIGLDVVPRGARAGDARCSAWRAAGERITCLEVCGAPAAAAPHAAAEARCCNLSVYDVPIPWSPYVGLSCLPDGEYAVAVRVFDHYGVLAALHELPFAIDRADAGAWYPPPPSY